MTRALSYLFDAAELLALAAFVAGVGCVAHAVGA